MDSSRSEKIFKQTVFVLSIANSRIPPFSARPRNFHIKVGYVAMLNSISYMRLSNPTPEFQCFMKVLENYPRIFRFINNPIGWARFRWSLYCICHRSNHNNIGTRPFHQKVTSSINTSV